MIWVQRYIIDIVELFDNNSKLTFWNIRIQSECKKIEFLNHKKKLASQEFFKNCFIFDYSDSIRTWVQSERSKYTDSITE